MIDPGFADPVACAQTSFRAILDAMSHPGRVVALGDGLAATGPLDPATAAALLTLVDAETTLWLDPALAGAAAWIDFHCGAPTAAPAAAAFGLARGLPDLAQFCAGTHEAPEAGATLIVQLPAVGAGQSWRLQGSGLEGIGALQATGLPSDFAARWARNAALFPRGIDLLLCAGHQAVALPRSVQVA